MKRKILLVLSIISLFSLTIFGLVSKDFFKNLVKVKADSSETLILSLDPEYRILNNQARILVNISGSTIYSSGVKVYYKTVDASAMSSQGDYEKEEEGSYIEIDKTYVITINIKEKDPYGVTLSTGEKCCRSFFVEIYKVEGNAEIDPNNNKISVSLETEYDYKSNKASDGLETLEGLDGNVTAVYFGDTTSYLSGDDEQYYYTPSINTKENASKIALYNNNMGHFYVTGGAYLTGLDMSLSSMGYCIGGVKPDGTKYTAIGFDQGGPFFFGYTVVAYGDDKYSFGNHFGTRNTWDYYKEDEILYTNNQYIDFEALGCDDDDNNFTVNNTEFYLLPDCDYTKFYFRAFTDGGYGRSEWEMHLLYVFIDDQHPDIVAYSIDRDYTDDAKIYISIRFSEPVQFNGAAPTYVTTVGGKASQKVTFNYECGEYTDTLVFSTKMNSITYDILIDEFDPYSFDNCKNIVDMSNTRNAYENYSYRSEYGTYVPKKYPAAVNSDLEIEIDNRTPRIELSGVKEISSSSMVQIAIENADKDKAHVYYSWSNDCTNAISITRLDSYSKEAKMNSSYNVKISSEGLTGVRFLWVKVVSPLGKTITKLLGPFYYDTSPDTISNITFVDSNAEISTKEKIITFDVDYSDSFITSKELSYIDLVYSNSSSWLAGTKYYYNKKEDYIGKNRFIDLSKPNTHLYNMGTEEVPMQYEVLETVTVNDFEFGMQDINEESSISKSVFYKKENNQNVTVTYNKKIRYKISVSYSDLGIAEGEYDKLYLGISLEDANGNITTVPNVYHSSEICRFDSRDVIGLETYYKFINSNKVIEDENNEIYYSHGAKIYFKLQTPIKGDDYELIVKKAGTENEYLSQEEIENYFDITLENKCEFTIYVKDTEGISGYYTIFMKITSDGEKFTEDYSFYLVSDDLDDSTRNIESIKNNKLFINKVYQISNEISYYYKDENNTVTALKYNDKYKLTFSSYDKAVEYLTLLEYQDLYLLEISSKEIASNINNNTNGYIKATNETQECEVGQYWIRYKRSTWNVKNVSSEQWCYYFYGYSNDTIDLDNLPSNLTKSIDTVIENLLEDYGTEFYLTSQDGLKNGIPYLDLSQIKIEDIVISKSLSLSLYKKTYTYFGDTEIYSTQVVIDDTEYLLSSNHSFSISDYTLLYLKGSKDSEYEKVTVTDGQMLKNLVYFSGLYSILEIDENGANEFTCYIDKDAPTVSIEIISVNSDGDDKTIELTTDSTASSYKYNAKTFILTGIDQEIDDYAYCAVFKTSGSKLLGVYSKKDLESKEVTLEEGRYYVEVYDRSGNCYTITLTLNSTQMEAYYKVQEDGTKFTVRVDNRSIDDIYRYEILYNGKMEISEFTDSISFTNSGLYSVYIEDWYGNVYSEEIDFVRSTPDITFRISTDNGYQTYKEGQSEYFSIELGNNDVYQITTSREFQMRIQKSPTVIVEVTWGNGKFDVGESSSYKTYELEVLTDTIFKVYYEDYPEIYALYRVIIDNEAPNISVTYKQGVYVQYERTEADETVSRGIGIKAGTVISPSNIYYYKKEEMNRTALNNSKISSKNIKLNITDASDITNIIVKFNDEEIYNGDNLDEIPSLNRFGKYTIIATDALNNTNLFSFTNEYQSEIECLVDGKIEELPVSSLEYFDLNNTYQNIFYGNESLEFSFSEDCTIVLKLENEAFSLFYMFKYENGVLYPMSFVTIVSDEPQYDDYGNIISATSLVADMTKGDQIFDYSAFKTSGLKYDTYYTIYTLEDDGIDMSYKLTSENQIYIKIGASTYETEIYDINLKVYYEDEKEPVFIRSILSGIKTDVVIKNENGEITTNQTEKLIYTNGSLTIDSDKLDRDLVSKIRVAYSKTNSFTTYQTVYELGEFIEFTMIDDGFYRIEITNIYGNINIYNICLSNELQIVTTVTYDDGKETIYSGAYSKTEFYSNKTITVDIYADYADVLIYKNDNKYSVDLLDKNGYLSFTLDLPGYYTLEITDKFSNKSNKTLVIDKQTLRLPSDMVYGFNEKALRKDEYYTNTLISINYDELSKSNFKVIELYKDNEYLRTIYDDVSENTISYNKEILENCIGVDGDGKYEIVFRDAYGNKITQEINYRKNSTITISRMTLTGEKEEVYDIDYVNVNQIYSNNYVSIKIDSKEYTFTDNSTPIKLSNNNVFKIEFTTDTLQTTSIVHEIYYLDDYGNEYEFSCILLRQNIEFDSLQSEAFLYDDEIFTRKAIEITFKDEYSCTYTIDNGDIKYTYSSGERLLVDGKYAFTLYDKAGNEEYYVITKDTSVAYTFTRDKSKGTIVDNEIVLDDNVELNTVSSDGVEIVSIFLDGKEITEKLNKFSDTGKWEIVLKDKLDNKSLFTFYIISHVVNKFSYTTPENIVITDLTRDTGEGIKISYVSKVYNDNKSFDMTLDGVYEVKLLSLITGETTTFSFEISTALPTATLDGIEDGAITPNNIKLVNTKEGDTIYVYKDGILSTKYVCSSDGDTIEIDEQGEYNIIIENIQGNTVEYSIIRKYMPNNAGNVLIIVLLVGLSTALFVAILYRNKSRVDK